MGRSRVLRFPAPLHPIVLMMEMVIRSSNGEVYVDY